MSTKPLQKSAHLTDALRQQLVVAAQQARHKAYAPYSHYLVGAALLTTDGQIYQGCNIENAAYSATICAERVALVKAVSEGHRAFTAVVVVTANGGAPCGTCRQMMYEFSPEMVVIISDDSGVIQHECLLSDLLPEGFGPAMLGKAAPGKPMPENNATP